MKLCKVCLHQYAPQKMGQKVCSHECAISLAVSQRGKAEKVAAVKERKADKVKRDKLKSIATLIAEAQAPFNLFIRLRDQIAGHACISSGKPLDWNGNGVDAGHYRSRGAAPHLRFDERNCHAQSKHDNRYLSGNVAEYRIGLIARIGQDSVDALESDQTQRKYSRDELVSIKNEYAAKARELKGRME